MFIRQTPHNRAEFRISLIRYLYNIENSNLDYISVFFANCDLEEPCACEGLDSLEEQSTIGHTAAAAITSTSLGIPLIVVVPPTPPPSETDVYNWDW